MTFVISAMIAGLAGAFSAQYITFIHPSNFTTAASRELIVMIIFGGLGSLPGTFSAQSR
ncbi:MAG: ABC transporter permease subunit [Christensenellales bacterium]